MNIFFKKILSNFIVFCLIISTYCNVTFTVSAQTADFADNFASPGVTVATQGIAGSNLRSLGSGITANAISVSTPQQLEEIARLVNAGTLEENIFGTNSDQTVHIKLKNDIDLSIYKKADSGKGWTAIGTDTNPFNGEFDGCGFTISGLSINRGAEDYQGLFGAIGGSVKNLTVSGEGVSGGSFVGGIAGRVLQHGSVTDCKVMLGFVSGSSDFGRIVGASDGVLDQNFANSSVNTNGGGGFSPERGGSTINGEDITAEFSGGNGATAATAYEINNHEQLMFLSDKIEAGDPAYRDKYYKLTDDIDLSAYTAGGGFKAIGTSANPFRGKFDGNAKIISGLYIDTGSDYQGLFGYIENAEIKNLGVINAYVSGGNNTGAIAGFCDSSSISNCFSTVTLEGGEFCGGIAGNATVGSVITNCYSGGEITGTENAGGISGGQSASDISYCYSAAEIYSGNNAGGITGLAAAGASVINCAAVNQYVISPSAKGRIIGDQSGACTLDANHAFENMRNLKPSGGTFAGGEHNNKDGKDASAGIFIDATLWTNSGVNFSVSDWKIEAGKMPVLKNASNLQNNAMLYYIASPFAGGDGSDAYPYEIANSAQLALLARLVNSGDTNYRDKSYRLLNNIDLSAYKNADSQSGWTPIGTASARFSGKLDGNNKKITGLFIDRMDYQQGLFGNVNGGEISNLGVAGCDVSGSNFVGGIAGTIVSGRIANCYVTGNINGEDGTGSITGGQNSSLITNCYSNCIVSGADNTGGVSGMAANTSEIINCYSLGSVTGRDRVGGIAGRLANSQIAYCYSLSNLSGYGSVGGIAGDLSDNVDTIINNCAALMLSINCSYEYAGRIVGSLDGDLNGSDCILNANLAYSNIQSGGVAFALTGSTKSHDGFDGADMTKLNVSDGTFWTNTQSNGLGFDTVSNWNIESGELPVLKNIAGQTSDIPIYLTGFAVNGLVITPLQVTKNALPQTQLVDFTVTGWESWTHNKITYTAQCNVAGMNANITSTVNGSATLTIPAGFVGEITVTAENIYSGKKTGAAVFVNKQQGAMLNTVPQAETITDNSIKVYAVLNQSGNGQAVEYAICSVQTQDYSSLVWQESTEFTGLLPETRYYVFARAKANGYYHSGDVKCSNAIDTLTDLAGVKPPDPVIPGSQATRSNADRRDKPDREKQQMQQSNWIESPEARSLSNNESTYAHSRAAGMTGMRREALEAIADRSYRHDTMLNNVVQVRLYIENPGEIGKDILVSGHVNHAEAERTRAKFGKYFGNSIRVIHMDQQESWGTHVKIAAKIDLEGMDAGNLYFYSYDKSKNAYRQIKEPKYRVDRKGYVHFTTMYAGEIIISDGKLFKR